MVKFSIYLNRCVFVMPAHKVICAEGILVHVVAHTAFRPIFKHVKEIDTLSREKAAMPPSQKGSNLIEKNFFPFRKIPFQKVTGTEEGKQEATEVFCSVKYGRKYIHSTQCYV